MENTDRYIKWIKNALIECQLKHPYEELFITIFTNDSIILETFLNFSKENWLMKIDAVIFRKLYSYSVGYGKRQFRQVSAYSSVGKKNTNISFWQTAQWHVSDAIG